MSGVNRWMMRLGTVIAGSGLLLAGVSGTVSARSSTTHQVPQIFIDGKSLGTAKYTTVGSAPSFRTSKTIPYWSSSFTYNGVNYPYTMAGSDPTSNASTTLHTVIIPLTVSFKPVNPITFDATSDVAPILASPVYGTASYGALGSNLQYTDALQRATFNKTGSNGYHLQLTNDTVYPTQTITVPQNQGAAYEIPGSSPIFLSLLDSQWFVQQMNSIMGNLHISPTTIPVFLADNTFLYESDNVNNCCVLGFHGASSSLNGNGKQAVQTYIFASYSTYGIFCGDAQCNTVAPIADVSALSHEVAELVNDPFVSNIVPPWSEPAAPQYGCSNTLEVGDPLVGFSPNTSATGYHPQDMVLAPWFMRQASPGTYNSMYTYPDDATTLAAQGASGFGTYSPACS